MQHLLVLLVVGLVVGDSFDDQIVVLQRRLASCRSRVCRKRVFKKLGQLLKKDEQRDVQIHRTSKRRNECAFAFMVQLVSHFGFFPSVFVAWKMRLYSLLSCEVFTLLTSLLYHVNEVLNSGMCSADGNRANPPVLLLNTSEGHWHRMDNVFSVLSVQFVCVYLAKAVSEGYKTTLLWTLAFSTMVCMEISPWALWATVGPLLIPVCLLVFSVWRHPIKRDAYAIAGFSLLPVALFCFAKGLDDEKDYLRIWHGCWHIAIGTVNFCFLSNRRKKWQTTR